VPEALELARRLGCSKLNALVGQELPGMGREEQLALARENVAWAAGRAAEYGVEVLVEAVNTFENGPYLLYTTRDAANFLRSVGAANVKIQYDFYHMQRMEGNLAVNVREHIGDIGHVQVADSPARGEPGTGEIRYPYLFGVLEELGYDGYVGLEYNPTTERTEDSFAWIPEPLRSSDVSVGDLKL
jgi:hydroxypyruvate isomerase